MAKAMLHLLKCVHNFENFVYVIKIIYICIWEDNIKMDIQEVGCGGMDWIELLRIGTVGGHLCKR